MAKFAFTRSEIETLNPCEDSMYEIKSLLGEEWATTPFDAKMAKEKGIKLFHLVWVAQELAYDNKEIYHRLIMFSADCAAHVLHIYEREFPNDDRPRKAILAARSGNLEEMKRVRKDSWKAFCLARNSFKWKAEHAALSADRILSLAAFDIALAEEIPWIAKNSCDGSHKSEQDWQYDRFCKWFSENPPEPYEI